MQSKCISDTYTLVTSIHPDHKINAKSLKYTHIPSDGITVTTERPQFFLLLAVQVMVDVRDVTVICTNCMWELSIYVCVYF